MAKLIQRKLLVTNAGIQGQAVELTSKQVARKLLGLNIALGAYYLSNHDNYQELLKLVARHWLDPEAKLEYADIASEDEGEIALLNTARVLSIYGFDPSTELLHLTVEGKEALAIYKANDSTTMG